MPLLCFWAKGIAKFNSAKVLNFRQGCFKTFRHNIRNFSIFHIGNFWHAGPPRSHSHNYQLWGPHFSGVMIYIPQFLSYGEFLVFQFVSTNYYNVNWNIHPVQSIEIDTFC